MKQGRQQEQQSSYSALSTYRQLITNDPTSSWSDKAQQRIDAILQRSSSNEGAKAAKDAAYEARRARHDAQIRDLVSKLPS